MHDLPIQLFWFGLVDRFLEPFCYGCAIFVVTYHLNRSLTVKLVAMLCGIVIFLWMDDMWPNLAFQEASMGWASENEFVAEALSENQSLGTAEFNSGQESGLFNIFDLRAADIFSAVVFVPLGFVIGMLMTGRRWHEVPSPTQSAAYIPKESSPVESVSKIQPPSSGFKEPIIADYRAVEKAAEEEEEEEINKNIMPNGLWSAYGVCILLGIVISILPLEQNAKDGLAGLVNLPIFIIFLVALLCAPIRIIQAAIKRDKRYLKAGLLCGLLSLVCVLMSAGLVAMNH